MKQEGATPSPDRTAQPDLTVATANGVDAPQATGAERERFEQTVRDVMAERHDTLDRLAQ